MINVQETQHFYDEISEGVVLVDFYATWCNPCKMLDNELKQLEGIKIIKVDTEEVPEVAYSYNVMGVPTLLLFKDGEPVARTKGYLTKEAIENLIESNL